METQVILVDDNDNQIGIEEKIRAHQDGGKLHRAFSVFVFNDKGETMMQKRAPTKHSARNIWSNTCCSHPYPNEATITAARRRLKEEMGFDCDLKEAFHFTYKADVGQGLTEHEYDHVFFGFYGKDPKPDPREVSDWKWVGLRDLKKEIAKDPKKFSPWVVMSINRVIEAYEEMQ
ncbi:MAG: isopentenyl-diphosphate Delta-isomerase [Candidatus Micrarchaeota archaeon]|nr:isopentenyl-diphosphate Delta-isomerase [Candidatus Micrarchaeota archaeon]MDE1824693.1 isopentenyl-diphosphate Delta-isomerase [Candidatus Micrarchaeota archaeon]MDE1849110.1 isopentenyl-diphosphate Delta-isomerase [Candidatus Micrarchaeota archaeon]